MGTHLSPFRYLQVARYLLHKLYESGTVPIASRFKGKAKAQSSHQHQHQRQPQHDHRLAYSTGVESSRPSSASEPPPGLGVAGPSTYRRPLRPDKDAVPEPSEIYRLMNDERLIAGEVKPPREIVVLCHGLYGFSTATPIPLFPSLKLHYWASVLEVLRDRMGVKVVVVGVKGTGSVKERAEQMHSFLSDVLPRGTGVNFVAHSMGGLDARYLISTIKPTSYTPLSLTSIGTPHHGSPFMDWCAANIGLGTVSAVAKAAKTASQGGLPPFSLKSPLLGRIANEVKEKDEAGGLAGFGAALTSYLLNIFDSPAYGNLTTTFLNDHFNPETPDSPSVKYTSVAGRTTRMSVLHPLWFPKLVLDAAAEKGYPDLELRSRPGGRYEGNDGLVSVSSAKWGEFLGAVDETHHWDLRGEGGLWPTGVTTEKKREGRPDGRKEGGWDWEGDLVGAEKVLGVEKADLQGKSRAEVEEMVRFKSRELVEEQSMTSNDKAKKKEEGGEAGSGWDVAQAGQVLDWVTDMLPGGKSTEVGKRQLAEARQQQQQDTEGKRREERREEGKRKKEKFDLARFYGGLMLKLREDGF